MTRPRKPRKPTKVGRQMLMLKKLDKFDCFYTESTPATVKSYGSRFGVKTKTEIVLAIKGYSEGKPKMYKLTKVTLLSQYYPVIEEGISRGAPMKIKY